MILRLVLRHEILHSLTKPLLVTVTTVSLVLNTLAFQMERSGSAMLVEGNRAALAQFTFLVPVVLILFLGKAGLRCRPWEAGLPLGARALWWSHLLALVVSALFLILVSGLSFLIFDALIGMASGKNIFHLADLSGLLARPIAASLVASSLIAVWRPRSGRMADAPGWSRYRYLVIVGAGLLLGLLLVLPVAFIPLSVALAAVMSWRAAARLPAALEMAGGDTQGAGVISGIPEAVDWTDQGPSRRVVRVMVLRTLFKWPLSWLALGPITILFGLMMSGHDVLGMDVPYLRFLYFFMSVYILFASTNHFMENLYKVDHLPIDRRILFQWLVLPVTSAFLLGYGAGRVMEALSADRPEKIRFENAEDNYGLKVPPEFFSFTTSSEPKLVSSPSGETHEVLAVQVFKGFPGVLWKPYATPAGASMEFVAWQISRAAAEVYGLEIEPEEISARYLETDLNRRVTVRDTGLTLAADYPAARPGSLGPVLPLLVGGEFALLLVVLAVFFRVFKPGITIRKSRVVFWLLMGGLMALHIGGYVTFMLGWTRDWLVHGFWLGRVRELGALGPAGYGAAWLGMFLLLAGTWRWAEKSFLAVEAPSS